MSAFVPVLILFPEASDEISVVLSRKQTLCLIELTMFYNNKDMDEQASEDRYLSDINGLSVTGQSTR